MYQVLARKWRPQSLEELIGQQHVARTLRNAIAAGRVAHAFLFAGVRGTGKTTVARIVAKCLNCDSGPTPTPCGRCVPCREITEGRALDVLELDAASRTGEGAQVDLRHLRRSAYRCSLPGLAGFTGSQCTGLGPRKNGSRETWRRERDSNPRYGFPYTRFPSVLLKPLGHLSVSVVSIVYGPVAEPGNPNCVRNCVRPPNVLRSLTGPRFPFRRPEAPSSINRSGRR